MRGGSSVRTSVSSPTFAGETLPTWISSIKGQPSELDVSAVLHTDGKKQLCIAVVNRAEREVFTDVPVRVAFESEGGSKDVEVHELWHEDLKAVNGFEDPDKVKVTTRKEKWAGKWTFKEHSFTLLVLDLA